MEDRAWFVRMYGEITPPRAFASGLSTGQAVKPCSILFVPRETMHVTRYLKLLKGWVHVSGDRVTIQLRVPLGSLLYAELEI